MIYRSRRTDWNSPNRGFEGVLLLRMLVCRLAVTVRILTMRLGRTGMYFRLVVFTLLVMLGCFPVLMRRHLVF
jgi:hypothetical protein